MNNEKFLKKHAPLFYSVTKHVIPVKKDRVYFLSLLKKEFTRDLSDSRLRGTPSCRS